MLAAKLGTAFLFFFMFYPIGQVVLASLAMFFLARSLKRKSMMIPKISIATVVTRITALPVLVLCFLSIIVLIVAGVLLLWGLILATTSHPVQAGIVVALGVISLIIFTKLLTIADGRKDRG